MELFSLEHTAAAELLNDGSIPYEALARLDDFIRSKVHSLGDEYIEVSPLVYIHKNAKISSNAVILPPAIIGAGSQLRTGAFIRGSVIIGKNAVVGNSVEVKNSILFDEAEVPHLSYIGDSILGYRAHFGAGAMTSNVRSDKAPVIIHLSEENINTGMMKLGALVGDYAEIGCNAVLNPGTVVGRYSRVYPLSSVRKEVPERCIHKQDGTIVKEESR